MAVVLAAWLCLLISRAGFLVGQEFAPATAEAFGTTEDGMVSWTPAQVDRLECRYFTGLKIVEAQRGLAPGQTPDDASCPWILTSLGS